MSTLEIVAIVLLSWFGGNLVILALVAMFKNKLPK